MTRYLPCLVGAALWAACPSPGGRPPNDGGGPGDSGTADGGPTVDGGNPSDAGQPVSDGGLCVRDSCGNCHDPSTDPNFCGPSSDVCQAGGSCVDGGCACPLGSNGCNRSPTTSACHPSGSWTVQCTADTNTLCGNCWNCLAAGQHGAGASCQGGTCVCQPPATFCGNDGICSWTAVDSYNCGACGNQCPDAGFCSAGACGASVVVLATPPSLWPTAPLAVAGGYVYSAEFLQDGGTISSEVLSVPTSGGPTRVMGDTPGFAYGLAADPGALYWSGTDSAGRSAIWYASLDGGAPALLAVSDAGSSRIFGVAVDAQSAYWTETNYGASGVRWCEVKSVPLDGGPVASLATGNGDCGPIAVNAGASVYWAEFSQSSTGEIASVGKDGGAATLLASLANPVSSLGITAHGLAWASTDSASLQGTLSVFSFDTGVTSTPYTGVLGSVVALDDGNVYFAPLLLNLGGTETLSSLPLDGGAAPTGLANVVNSQGAAVQAAALAVDAKSLYWITASSQIVRLTPK